MINSLVLLSASMFFQAAGPTRLPEAQVAIPPTAVAAVRVTFPDGTSRYVQFSGAFTIDQSTTPWTLKVSVPAPLPLVQEKLTRNGDGTWNLSRLVTGAIVITRNGLTMFAGQDFTISGTIVTFTAAQGSLNTDTILAMYQ
jgi:hypothetical protein